MLRILLASTTAAALLAGGALAQSDNSADTRTDPPAQQSDTSTPGSTGMDSTAPGSTADSADADGERATDDTAASGTDQPAGSAGDTAASDTRPNDMGSSGSTGSMNEPAASTAETTVPPTTGEGRMDRSADSATTMSTPAPGSFIAAQSGTDMLAKDLIGRAVVNPQDEKVGDVSDLLMDESGRVTAAVIGIGGFLGIGEKSVGVPIEALEPRQTENGDVQLVTMLTREELEAAPEFVDLKEQRKAEAAASQPEPASPATPGAAR